MAYKSKTIHSVIIISKNGDVLDDKMKNTNPDIFYKKCGIKSDKLFGCCATFSVESTVLSTVLSTVELWAKTDGRAGQENKYDFPPPVDNSLFFGSCLLVGYDADHAMVSIDSTQWNVIYEQLFGGFENMDDTAESDENEIDELACIPDKFKTRDGYLKDGFVVDDNDSIDSELSPDEYL